MKLFKHLSGGITLGVVVGLSLLIVPSAQADAPPAKCVVVHRGFDPENSIPGLRKSGNEGACGWETDVRTTRDHIKILNHDSTLNRTTTGKGRVKDRSWRYISRLHVRKRSWGHASHAKVATYEQGLILCRDSQIQVCLFEAKRGMAADDVLSMATEAVAIMGAKLYKVVIETDTYRDTRIIKQYPQIAVGFVGFSHWPSVSDVQANGANGIIVDRRAMSYARVTSAARKGLWVMPYTVETHKQLVRVRRMGAHGAMTDSSRLVR